MIEFIINNPFLAAVIALVALGLVFGAILGFGAVKFAVDGDPIVDQINAILPQTQCGQCGYPGCKPYAEAIANGDAINKCPPGGEAGIIELANLLDVEPMALDDEHGVEDVKKVAYIREDECIGCTKCIQACPIDAILGAAKQMHTVIAKECTGCDLCVEPCPVDCIDMIPAVEGTGAWKWDIPDRNPTYNANIIVTDRSSLDRDAGDSGKAA